MGKTATAAAPGTRPRLKRNNATENLLANKTGKSMVTKTTTSSKRKAEDDLRPQAVAKTGKRAAFGDLTNALSDKTGNASSSIKTNVKKGINQVLGKGKAGGVPKVKETKSSILRQFGTKIQEKVEKSASTTEEEISEISTTDSQKSATSASSLLSEQSSSSSEEILFCNVVGRDKVESDEVEEEPLEKVSKQEVQREPVYPTPPEGVIDFDQENLSDPSQHSQYAMETFQYYKDREALFHVPSYISAQVEITEAMRAILVDWLVEVQESFELNHETLYAAVKMTDIYLSKKQVRKEDLQLVGATACLVSCKIDERIPPMVDDFLYVCDDAYSRDQIMKMERKMLKVVGFDLGYPLSYRYLRRYGRVCKVTMPVLTLARYILEMSLMEYKYNVELSESLLAASCLVLAFKIKEIEGWVPTLSYYSGYTPLELADTVSSLHKMLQQPAKDNLKTVRSKYSHKVFHEVASIAIPDVVSITNEG